MTMTQTIQKRAGDVEVGEVLVYRPDPTALTIDVLPTCYRRVERIETIPSKWGSGTLVDFLYRMPRNAGHWHSHDADELVEVAESEPTSHNRVEARAGAADG